MSVLYLLEFKSRATPTLYWVENSTLIIEPNWNYVIGDYNTEKFEIKLT